MITKKEQSCADSSSYLGDHLSVDACAPEIGRSQDLCNHFIPDLHRDVHNAPVDPATACVGRASCGSRPPVKEGAHAPQPPDPMSSATGQSSHRHPRDDATMTVRPARSSLASLSPTHDDV
jgi:hypothetical protein